MILQLRMTTLLYNHAIPMIEEYASNEYSEMNNSWNMWWGYYFSFVNKSIWFICRWKIIGTENSKIFAWSAIRLHTLWGIYYATSYFMPFFFNSLLKGTNLSHEETIDYTGNLV